jgi:hypothetical protein
MKLTPEALADWFFTANPKFSSNDRAKLLAMLATPPAGATRSQIVVGLKQAISDTLLGEMEKSEADRRKIEAALAAKGLPSFNLMRARTKKMHKRILGRGLIKNDEEFSMVAEILADVDSEITSIERASLGRLVRSYESAKA